MNVEVNALMEQVCHLEDCRMLLISEKGDLQKQLEEAKWHIKQLRTQVQSLQGSAESDGNDDRTMQVGTDKDEANCLQLQTVCKLEMNSAS